MAYFEPYIDATGLHIPTYIDIKEHLISEAKYIFGDDIYLENDSQDYQFISLTADKIHDGYQAAQYIYNNRGPSTAIGAGLDGIVKLNGIKRKQQTKSTCDVVITGTAKTTINNGIVADIEGINWDLPEKVTIGTGGTVTVTAECQEYEHTALAGEINKITTPTSGWESVINYENSTKGQSYETDAELKARQAISTAKPSLTVYEGILGGVAEIDEVTRYRLYENDTRTTDENGIPGHSISLVVEGGNDEEIAQEIFLRKTPGCGTYGDVAIDIENEDINGDTDITTISFFRPAYKDIYATIYIKSLAGYSSTISDNIKSNVNAYLNSLRIGDNLTLSALWAVSFQAMPSITSPVFSVLKITAGLSESEQYQEDIEILFNEVTRSDLSNINIVLS